MAVTITRSIGAACGWPCGGKGAFVGAADAGASPSLPSPPPPSSTSEEDLASAVATLLVATWWHGAATAAAQRAATLLASAATAAPMTAVVAAPLGVRMEIRVAVAAGALVAAVAALMVALAGKMGQLSCDEGRAEPARPCQRWYSA